MEIPEGIVTHYIMSSKELPSMLGRLAIRQTRLRPAPIPRCCRRNASTESSSQEVISEGKVAQDIQELEGRSTFTLSSELDEHVSSYDPAKRAQGRRKQLPPSRYQFRSPRYYRGPLHPHQPPPKSDPASREYIPGPFSHTRLEQTYQAMIAPDLMTLGYIHRPPGTPTLVRADRLRTWDDSSPYHKGRPKRGPRGPGEVLRVVEKDIDWQNIPKITEVTVHSMVKGAIDDPAHLHIAGMMLRAITGVQPIVHRAKKSVGNWGLRERMPISLTCNLRGDQAYDFVDKVVNLVFPRIKDWPGIKGTTGDSAGNLSWGFTREGAILFPEVEINYDMYPPKMIPGFHVTVKTSATSDRHARLLLKALGVPFTGKLID